MKDGLEWQEKRMICDDQKTNKAVIVSKQGGREVGISEKEGPDLRVISKLGLNK